MQFGLKTWGFWLLALGVLATASAGCRVTQSTDTPVPEFSKTEMLTGAKYCLYVPSDYDASRTYPLVVAFHATHGFDSGKTEVQSWKALAEKHKFIVVGPELASPQGLLPMPKSMMLKDLAEDEKRVLAVIKEVKHNYSIDEKALLVSGFSAGGYPLYYIGLRNPDLFSCMAAMSANFEVDLFKDIPITDRMRKMPFVIMYGKSGINPIYSKMNPISNESWDAYKYLRTAGCDKTKIESREGGHDRRPADAFRFWQEHLVRLREPKLPRPAKNDPMLPPKTHRSPPSYQPTN